MTSLVRVEQLLIGWSRTSNGKNVLARSPGWPEGTRQEWVDELGDFLDPAIDRVVRETGEAPWLVEFRPSRHGSILMAKVYAAESLRAGEFQVHALLDPSRRLGPQHLPGLVEAGTLLLERPEDVLRLESIQVEVPPVWEVDARVLALALQFAHCGGSLVLRAHGLPEAMDLLGSVCAALPGLVARETIARSVVTDAADVEGIGVAVAPWSASNRSWKLVAIPDKFHLLGVFRISGTSNGVLGAQFLGGDRRDDIGFIMR